MARIILSESQFKGYLKKLYEEEQASEINVGDFSTPDEANAFLAMIRQKYGFSKLDSWVKGTSVFIMVEKDNTDDSHFYDIIDSVKNDAKTSAYNQVCEGEKGSLLERNFTYRNKFGERMSENSPEFDIVGTATELFSNKSYAPYPYGVTIRTQDNKEQYIALFGQDYNIEIGKTYRIEGYISDPGYIKQYCAKKVIPLD